MAQDAGRNLPVRRERNLFELKPITLDGFILHARGIEAVGRPGVAKWATAMQFAMAAEESSPFWVGDLWNYSEAHGYNADDVQQALASIGRTLALKTLQNHGAIAKNVTPKAKELAPSIGHADVVSALDADEQVKWLRKASDEEMTIRDLRMEVRASRRTKILEGQAVLDGMYRVIYADPPWLYGDSGPTDDGSLGKAERHYPGMTIEELCKLPVGAHALPDSVLWMWVTAPMLYENPGPREVIEAWGFTPKTGYVWDKVLGNFGHYSHVCHEHLIVATRGSCMPDAPTPQPKSVITERRSPEHSEKPESARKIIEKLYIYGPFLELFGRERHEGWDVFGNDARLWAEEVANV